MGAPRRADRRASSLRSRGGPRRAARGRAFVRATASFVRRARENAAHTGKTLGLVWRSSPPQTLALALVTLTGGLAPLGVAYAAKRIVDAILAADVAASTRWVALELACVAAVAGAQRAQDLVRSVLGARLGLDVGRAILAKALRLRLACFEDSEFRDRLLRAQSEATTRPIALVVESFALVENLITLVGYALLVARFSGLSGAARVVQVTVVASPAGGEPAVVTLDARPLTLGREPEGARTLTLADERASRSHATITHDERTGTWSVNDLGGRNGLFVDGKRTSAAPLRHGTVVRIGQSLLVVSDVRLAEGERLGAETPALRGGSVAMRRVRGEIERVAPRAVPVMVLGETGTGKECVARELHRLSGRTGPFVGVNCAAIPEALAESELFGHGVGAFTGATQRAEGLFVAADRGTLFLDEVAELPASVQAKLLRVLATREVRALGQHAARPVDVRIVSASPRELSGGGSFREDLFARLAVWTIRLPPLRDRKDDVLALARAFSEREPQAPPLATSAAEALLLYDWPRNVRELEGVLVAAAIRAADAPVLRCEHLPEAIGAPVAARAAASPGKTPLELLVPPSKAPSAGDLRLVLERFGGSVALVAKYFAKDRRQVYRWLERAGIEPEAYRKGDDEGE